MDGFAICQAFAQLESDYDVGGLLRERPSNQRRNESIGYQLSRIGYSNRFEWVDIETAHDDGDCFEQEVAFVYLDHALKWKLPFSPEMLEAAQAMFTESYLSKFLINLVEKF
jgi:hypothetical protein